MKKYWSFMLSLVMALSLVFVGGCQKKEEAPAPSPAPTTKAPSPAPEKIKERAAPASETMEETEKEEASKRKALGY